MKIKINEKESYEILIENEELDCDEFLGLLNRLKEIEKIILKIGYSNSENGQPQSKHVRKKRSKKASWIGDRDKVVELMKLMWFGSKEDKEKFAIIEGREWNDIIKSIHYGKDKFDIKPEEVGLVRFPVKGEGMSVDGLRLKSPDEFGVDLREDENKDEE